jgi:hypothetical protein
MLINCVPSKIQMTKNVAENSGKKKPSYTAGGNIS